MSSTAIVRFEDGSAVSRNPEADEIEVDGGVASLVMAWAQRAIDGSPAEALSWFRGTPPPSASGVRIADGMWELQDQRTTALVSVADFRLMIAAAYAIRFRDESLWLFRPDPIACVASPGDCSFGKVLEPRVKAFDEAVRNGELGDPRESARRRIIFAEVRASGLLDGPLLDRKIEVLDELELPHLKSLASAAQALASYYTSPEREKYVRLPAPANIHEAALSLDWARSVQPPDGIRSEIWWAVCEESFLSSAASKEFRGRIIFLQGRLIAELLWRLEDGSRRALYSALSRRL